MDTAFPGEESLGGGHHHVEELVRIQLDDQLPLEAGERVELPPAGPLSREEVDSPEGGGGLGHEGGGQCEILVREAPRPSGVRGDETDQGLAELERGHQCAGVAGTAETISQGRRQPWAAARPFEQKGLGGRGHRPQGLPGPGNPGRRLKPLDRSPARPEHERIPL